jgi:hypothetical protein
MVSFTVTSDSISRRTGTQRGEKSKKKIITAGKVSQENSPGMSSLHQPSFQIFIRPGNRVSFQKSDI